MANYLYNGIELPALPEWNREQYPYAVITKLADRYAVRFFSVPRVVRLGGHLEQIVGTVYLIASYQDGAWGEIRSVVEDGEGSVPAIVWANFDVYYAETTYPESYAGTLYLAASDPVPVYDPTALLQGYLVGCRIRAMRGKKKIVGYSYNGTVLPGLPEWDKTAYPYACITSINRLTLLGADAYYFWKNDVLYFGGNSEDASVPGAYSQYADGEWGEATYLENQSAAVHGSKWLSTIWSNFDMEYDGTLYLAASDPVPVFE